MNARHIVCALACLALPAAALIAQTATPESKDFENSNMAFLGTVAADALAHSGPSLNDYAVVKLRKDQQVVVVGMKYDWLKIQPPEDAFCVMLTGNVEVRGDGKVGRVMRKASVRMGSTIVGDWSRAATPLEGGVDVQIIEKTGQFYKIKPPKGVYIYVEKKSVVPERRLELDPDGEPVLTTKKETIAENVQTPTEERNDGGAIVMDGVSTKEPTTKPSELEAPKPAFDVAKIEAFDKQYDEGMKLPMSQRPHAALLSAVTETIALPGITASALTRLQAQQQNVQQSQKQLESQVAFKKQQDAFAVKARELSAEQSELEARAADAPKRYAAIGKLTHSNLQVGRQTLYRLVDPGTGRTLVYLRSGDASVLPMLDQLVGVRGQIVNDTSSKLKYVQPDAIDAVAADQVGSKVFADMTPPSMLENVTGVSPQ